MKSSAAEKRHLHTIEEYIKNVYREIIEAYPRNASIVLPEKKMLAISIYKDFGWSKISKMSYKKFRDDVVLNYL